MTVSRKTCWICCPVKNREETYAAVYLVIDPLNPTINYDLRVYGVTLFASADRVVRFCPACGKPVPTVEALATMEALVDQ